MYNPNSFQIARNQQAELLKEAETHQHLKSAGINVFRPQLLLAVTLVIVTTAGVLGLLMK